MTPAEAERGTRILHAILAAGVAIIIALFVLLLRMRPPMVPPGAARPIVAYVSAGLGVVAILAAIAALGFVSLLWCAPGRLSAP